MKIELYNCNVCRPSSEVPRTVHKPKKQFYISAARRYVQPLCAPHTPHSGKVSQEDDDDGHVVGGATVECLTKQPLGDHVGRFGGVAAAVDDARVVKHLDGQAPAKSAL